MVLIFDSLLQNNLWMNNLSIFPTFSTKVLKQKNLKGIFFILTSGT